MPGSPMGDNPFKAQAGIGVFPAQGTKGKGKF
jgi:hypothetical protein